MLLDLSPAGDLVGSLFQDEPLENGRLMQAVDRINGRFGRGSIGLALTARTAEWRMRQERLSPALHHPLAGPGGGEYWTDRAAHRSRQIRHSAIMRGTDRGLKPRRVESHRCAASIRHANALLSIMVYAQVVMLLQVARQGLADIPAIIGHENVR